MNQFETLKYNQENNKQEEENKEQCVRSLKNYLADLNFTDEPLKTIKRIIEENISYYSPGIIYCYWNGPNQISNRPPGIAILSNDSRDKIKQLSEPYPINFMEITIQNLEYLYLTPAGKMILDQLLDFSRNNTFDENIFIMPLSSQKGNNIIYQTPKHALHAVAQELTEQPPGPRLITALQSASKKLYLDDPYQWLAQCINEMPALNFIGFPGEKSFLLEQQIKFNGKDIENWINGELELPPAIKNHFINAVIVALHDYATPNRGTGSIIRWNPSPEYEKNQQRPPAIGLGHELCHAYYNALGMQPGHQDFGETTVLFEYLTTGLGPWKTTKICENALRKEWNNILSKIAAGDHLNNKPVEERAYYSMDIETPDVKSSCMLV